MGKSFRASTLILRAVTAIILALACTRPVAAAGGQPATTCPSDEAVDAAIKRGVAFLWSQQNAAGHWDQIATAAEVKLHFDTYKNYSGPTALALIALLNAGVDPKKPEFQKAVKWVAEQKPTGTYALGLRCVLWNTLDLDTYHPLLKEEALTLQNGIYPFGTYTYLMRYKDDTGPVGDFSNTQYGLLGVWAGADRGVEINAKYWKLIEHGYLASQLKDGGWPYQVNPAVGDNPDKGKSRMSVSLGAIASLFVIWDNAYCRQGCDAKANPELIKAIRLATDWAGQEFTRQGKAGHYNFDPYLLYGLERAGVASGLKYFGDFDWYPEAATVALRTQYSTGAWADSGLICGTSWTILFLEFGRAPVLFNKLAWGTLGDWNSRPRDLANLSHKMGKVFEKKLNWQVMPTSATAPDLHDAPILFIEGRTALKLNADEKAKLKNYVLQGGTLLFSPAGRAPEFAHSVEALIRGLFGDQELRPVPNDSPILGGKFPVKPPLPMTGLFNGIRWTVLISETDLGCPWQEMRFASSRNVFNLAYNLYNYVSDGGQLIGRGRSYLLADTGNRPAQTVTVGRLMWAATQQADPEPAAWTIQDIRLRNANAVAVRTMTTDLAEPLDPAAVPLLHVTGFGTIRLNEKAQANLKDYVSRGGLVLADAAGGDGMFADSFAKRIGELFGAEALVPAAGAGDLPFLKEAVVDGMAWYRHRFDLPRAQRKLDVMVYQPKAAPGHVGVVFLPYDLTSAMVGYPSAAPVGLAPESANRFISALMHFLQSRPGSGAGIIPNN